MKKITTLILVALTIGLGSLAHAQTQFVKYKNFMIPISVCEKPKVIITTDYGPLSTSTAEQNGHSDANEAQDMVHYLAYSNHFDTRALIVNKFHSSVTTSALNSTLTRYGFDSPFFSASSHNGFPSEGFLKSVLFIGVANQGSNQTPQNSNAATQQIINEAAAASPDCPVNILVWGPMTDVAAALHFMPTGDRDNIRIVAIGSTNRLSDSNAWQYVKDIKDAGGTIISENIIFSDLGNPDAFRSLFLGHTCGVNPTLYNDGGIIGRVEDIMDDLTDFMPSSNAGLRGLLQASRGSYSNIRLANWTNCQALASTSANSLRMGDSLTTMYLLDEVMGFDGALKQIIEDNDGTSSGIKNPAVLRQIYDHYRVRMSDIY